ncbi:28641_t:CDS:2, partial [Dentiscutata erythropus]
VNNVRFSDKLEHSSTHSVKLAPVENNINLYTKRRSMAKYYDEYQNFILIDFDYANYPPSDKPLKELFESDHAPEMLTKGHNFKVDI